MIDDDPVSSRIRSAITLIVTLLPPPTLYTPEAVSDEIANTLAATISLTKTKSRV